MKETNPYDPPKTPTYSTSPSELNYLDNAKLKSLGSYSRSLHFLGVFWFIAAILALMAPVFPGNMGPKATLAFIATGLVYGVGAFACIKRPAWGRTYGFIVCAIAFSLNLSTDSPSFLPLLIATGAAVILWKGAPLFGPNGVSHKELKEARNQRLGTK